jgi:hypothetical protein
MAQIHDEEWFKAVIAEDEGKGQTSDELIAQIQEISDWYDNTPSVLNEETVGIWRELARESAEQADRMMSKYNVNLSIVDGQPYNNLQEMSADIGKGRIAISRDNSSHPVFNEYETISLRIWHDLTHYEIQSNFSFLGECATYRRQVEHTGFSHRNTFHLQHALYCDIVGQVANGLVHRVFPEQKVFTLKHKGDL